MVVFISEVSLWVYFLNKSAVFIGVVGTFSGMSSEFRRVTSDD